MEIKEQLEEILKELRASPLLSPPFTYEKSITQDFKKRTDEYYQLIRKLSKRPHLKILKDISRRLINIDNLSDNILKSMSEYLNGSISNAYKLLEHSLEKTEAKKYLLNSAIPLDSLCNNHTPLHRVRSSSAPLQTREEMFHIPFSKRHLVEARRYSISGVPCLYLGTSLLVCWQEMGKPDFDKMYISSFYANENASNYKLLNLAFTLESLLSFTILDIWTSDLPESEHVSRQISNFMIWPLVLACNYPKKHDDGRFNAEYIIPNLLTQWICNNDNNKISGICYKTTKMLNKGNSNIGLNIVLPPKRKISLDDDKEFCAELAKTFLLTKPVAWQVFRTLNVADGDKSLFTLSNDSLSTTSKIDDFDEFLVTHYVKTEFKKIEELIKNMMQFGYLLEAEY